MEERIFFLQDKRMGDVIDSTLMPTKLREGIWKEREGTNGAYLSTQILLLSVCKNHFFPSRLVYCFQFIHFFFRVSFSFQYFQLFSLLFFVQGKNYGVIQYFYNYFIFSAAKKDGLNVFVFLDCIKQPTQLGLYEFAVTVCNPWPSFHQLCCTYVNEK